MSDHYDRLENRPSASRETILFRDLRHVLATAKPRVAALRAQLRGIDVAALRGRAELARVPIARGPVDAGAGPSPGGLAAMRSGGLKQAFLVQADGSADVLLCPEGQAKDWWGMGRALFAAGLRRGTTVLNCFPYDLVPHGHMVASGAAAIGAPLVPAGAAALADKAEVVRRLRPGFFCGEAAELKALLDHCAARGIDARGLARALVLGPLPAGLRHELGLRGVAVRRAVALPAFGVVAYESDTPDALTLNEGLICEIVDRRTGDPVAPGRTGEVVLTRVNGDYPVLRHATGLWSAALGEPATCGRTNMRIRPPRPAADATPAGGMGERIMGEPVMSQGVVTEATMVERGTRLRGVVARHPKPGSMAEPLRLVADERGTFEIVAPGDPGVPGEDEAADERRRS